MSQTRLQAAKELIQNKDYDAARSVLRTLPDDPTAIKWLAQVDRIAPQAPIPKAAPQKPRGFDWPLALCIIVAVAVLGGFTFMAFRQNQSSNQSAAEASCGIIYDRYSTQWQNCVDDLK